MKQTHDPHPRGSDAPSFFNTRAAVLITSLPLFVIVVIFYTPASALAVFSVLLTDGLFAAGWIAGATALGAFVLGLFRVRANWLLLIPTAAGLGLGFFSLTALGLGLAGWLNRGVALAMPATGLLLFGGQIIQAHGASREIDLGGLRKWLFKRAGLYWLWLVPLVSLATVCVAASVMPGDLWKPLDPHPYDVVSYHLQAPREWYEMERIAPLKHNVFSYFPFNVEMQFLLLMHAMGGAWNAMYACQFISLGYAALMVMGVAGAAQTRGENNENAAGVVGAATVSVVPWVMMLASVAYVESAVMLYTVLAIAWVMRAMGGASPDDDSATISDGESAQACGVSGRLPLILAGLFAGFACGAKITSVPMLLIAIPIAILVAFTLKRPAGLKCRAVGVACFVFAGSVVLSPWLIRNVIWARNPLFPIAMKTLGQAHFTDDQVERFRVAHSPPPALQPLEARLPVVWTDVVGHWQYGYVLLPAGLLAAVGRWRDRQSWFLLVTALVIFVVWIGFTHLLARFLVMLIPIAGILLNRVRWGRAWPMAAMIVITAGAFGWTGVYDRLAYTTRDPNRTGLVGVQDLSMLVPPQLTDMKNAHKQVALIGDAGAFLYQIPMSRLHYRTVFDVPGNESNPVAAWAGTAGIDSNWLLVINPSEIDRLHRTYRKIPALPPSWPDQNSQPFVVSGDDPLLKKLP